MVNELARAINGSWSTTKITANAGVIVAIFDVRSHMTDSVPNTPPTIYPPTKAIASFPNFIPRYDIKQYTLLSMHSGKFGLHRFKHSYRGNCATYTLFHQNESICIELQMGCPARSHRNCPQ